MYISAGILKYGLDNFKLEILEYCLPEITLSREQYYLDLYRPEYNILKVAGSSKGYKHTTESKSRKSSHVVSEETLNKMSQRIQNDATKAKISTSLGISVQVLDTTNEESIVFEYKKLASEYLGRSDSTIGRYIKSKKLLFNRYFISLIS